MSYDGSLIFDTEIDVDGFNQGTASISKQASGLKKTFTGLGKSIATAFAVTQIIKFGQEAINLASDIQEVQNVVDTAFGDMKYKMETFAKSAIEIYGISKLTAKQTGSTFMAMAKAMGLADEASSNMALQLTALSADMASFYNKTQEITSIALKSVFTGETETLKQFGIVMTEANLEAFRLAQGIEKSYKKMNQAEKTALRYNFVMSQTNLAQGDFLKTQDSWANQTRILTERWKEFLGILGNGLIKILTPLIKALNKILEYLITIGTAISNVFSGEKEISNTIGESVKNQESLTEAVEETEKANKKSLASFDEIQRLTSSANENANAAVSGGIGFEIDSPYNLDSEIDTTDLEKKLERLSEKLQPFKDFTSGTAEDFNTYFLKPLSEFTGEKFVNFAGEFEDEYKSLSDTIENNTTLDNLRRIFASIYKKLEPVVEKLIDFIFQLGEIFLPNALSDIETSFKNIDETTGLIADLLEGDFSGAWEHAKKIATNSAEDLKKDMKTFKTFVETLGTNINNFFTNTLGPALGKSIANFKDDLAKPFKKETWINMMNGVKNAVTSAFEEISSWFTEKKWKDAGKNIHNGLATGINNAIDSLQKLVNPIIDFFNGVINGYNSIAGEMGFGTLKTLSYPDFSKYKIPKLATGTVVPANYGEFAAILGDNKRETEVVSPLSTMKQALIEALAESGQNITIKFEESSIGDLVRLLKPYIDKENRRIGSSTRVAGGAY